MPALPAYRQQVLPNSTGTQPRLSSFDPGEGLREIGHSLANIAAGLERRDDALRRKEEEDGRAWSATAVTGDEMQWTEYLARKKEEAPLGASGFAGSVVKEFDAATGAALQRAPTEAAKRFYAQSRALLRARLFDNAVHFEANQGVKWRNQQWDQSIENISSLAVSDPDAAKQSAAKLDAILKDSAYQEQALQKRAQLRAAMSKAGASGMVERNPQAALDLLNKRIGVGKPGEETGDAFIDGLDAQTLVTLQNRAQSHVLQAENRAKLEADKREREADRAISAATRQIEAGVPLSVDAWDTLRAKVSGTGRAGEFNALVIQERETQQVLRLPLSQQDQYVQQREAKLMQEGGTMVDRANLSRIKTAIETNRKEIEQAPLVAAQRLYGRTVQPLDLADLINPGGTQRAAAAFADRMVTLQAMGRQFGAQVGEKPLLPQERQALSALLDKASPSEALQLFGALRGAIDDDDTYQAAMQQIAPDSPVRARAGVLAAAGKSITLEENLIADDVRVPSARVASTVLSGERILNATKRQRAEDGKGSSLFVPSREAFAAAFADKVKNLYRGRPGAQDADLQTAFAYYVGKAAELGQAADGSNIDGKLASESVTATLGALVDFNGRGTVKAPLGMTADQFKSRMSERFAELVKEEKLPASVLGFYSHYGAANYRRDGTYVLTLGDAPVVNPKTGQPVVIDLAPVPLSGSPYRSAADLIPGQRTRQDQGGRR